MARERSDMMESTGGSFGLQLGVTISSSAS